MVGEACFLYGGGRCELSSHRYCMGPVDRDTHAGASDLQVRQVENFAAFIDHLQLFPRVAAFDKLVDMGDDVKGDLLWVDLLWDLGLALGECLNLAIQLLRASTA